MSLIIMSWAVGKRAYFVEHDGRRKKRKNQIIAGIQGNQPMNFNQIKSCKLHKQHDKHIVMTMLNVVNFYTFNLKLY